MKRYGLVCVAGETHAESYCAIERVENGDYVLFEDAVALLSVKDAEIASLRKVADAARDALRVLQKQHNSYGGILTSESYMAETILRDALAELGGARE